MILLGIHIVYNQEGKEKYGPYHSVKDFLDQSGLKNLSQKEELSSNPIKVVIKILKDLVLIYKNNDASIYIGFDPINAFAGILGKFIFNKKLKTIFYSVDFSKNRFNNFILDKIYVSLDNFVSLNCNETWSCSSKVYSLRKSFLPKEKNIYSPNIPVFKIPKLEKYEKFTVVYSGFLNRTFLVEYLIKLIDLMNEESFNLHIIGDGERFEEVKNIIDKKNLQKRVFLNGYIPHSEVIEILKKSHIGLALYSGSETYDEYKDSIKIREFTYLELPTITTKFIPNWQEIEKNSLGFKIQSFEELILSIHKLQDIKTLKKFQENCRVYNEKFSIKNLYRERLSI